ncbi:tetratricopeptide repeat protein, partial [Psychroserpens sp.]|uniref:tetratricopeptide repeat protein n=1 Tax=Psychroserpens sp. TaxID=2020870 RepID=UPI00385A71D3
NIGNVYIYRQDYRLATQYFSKALKIYQEEGDKENESQMLTSLGSVYLIIHNYELALNYYQKALVILDKRGFEDRRTAIIYINIGWTNYEKGGYKEAKNNYTKGLKILQVKNEKFFIASCYSTLARINLKLNLLDEANDYAAKNLALNKELDIKTGIINAKIIIALITFETNIKEATRKGEAILTNLPVNTNKEIKKSLYELLYKCYKSQNKLALSLEMHELYTSYNDSIQQEKNNFAVAKEVVKNDFDLKLQENKVESEKEKAALKIIQLKRTYGIIASAVLLMAFIIYYFIASRKKMRQRRDALLKEIESLKINYSKTLIAESNSFELKREKIETSINRKLNETDWNVLKILFDDPVITNNDIAEKAFMSVPGIGSSLRRMYEYFNIKESKYKKISLLLAAIKISNSRF